MKVCGSLILFVVALAACSALAWSAADPTTPPAHAAPVASAPTATPKPELPALNDDKPRDLPGLHNIVAYHEGFYSGGVPEDEAAFALLKAMGIKTIISVDGAEPDVAAAKALGIRYIHLPIGYNGFDEQRKLELARATRDAMQSGPVYLHCHHGKHRSAGAAGAIAATLGWMTPQEAVERMKVSGTAPNYKGLYTCAATSTELDPKVIDAVPADFPEVSHPASFVKAMVEIDEINDHLKLIEKAGWSVPKDHPDLVPAAEAGRMADLFRISAESTKSKSKPADFSAALKQDSDRITALEAMLIAQEKDANKLSNTFKQIQASCKDCHAKYRD